MTDKKERSLESKDFGVKLNLVLKRLAALEDMFLLGDKVYSKISSEVLDEFSRDKSAPQMKAHISLESEKVSVGEDLNMEIQIHNASGVPAFLTRIESFLPWSFELVSKPSNYSFDGAYLHLNGRRLDPSITEDVKLTLRAFEKGKFHIKPRIAYSYTDGHELICEPKPANVEVLEVAFPHRISTGYKGLDYLLFGGIPENYAVVLSAISCDERDLLVKRFLQAGMKGNQVTLHVTTNANEARELAEDSNSFFHVVVCNPHTDTDLRNLPNVRNLKGVENLNDLNIALTETMRKLETLADAPKRACIGIVSDVLLQHRAVQTRRWLTGLLADLSAKDFTTLAVMNPFMHPSEDVHAVVDLFDGEISISEDDLAKFLRIKKLRDQEYLESELRLKRSELTTIGAPGKGKYARL